MFTFRSNYIKYTGGSSKVGDFDNYKVEKYDVVWDNDPNVNILYKNKLYS